MRTSAFSITALCGLIALAHAAHIQPQIRNGQVPCRAVNLGSWLLAEHWMSTTSPIWKGVPEQELDHGEYAAMTALGEINGTAAFQQHWATWIVEDDLRQIALTGLNTVRVPVGHWIINDDPAELAVASAESKVFARGGLKYLDKLVNDWAVKYNLAVMISLHAHQGSQNGYEHGAPPQFGNATWASSPDNVNRSLRFATFLADRYNASEAFLGMALMNEPGWGQDYNVLLQYYEDAYKKIRIDHKNDCILVTSPWIQHQNPEHMADFMPCPTYYNVWHEWHLYFKWGWERRAVTEIVSFAYNYARTHLRKWRGNPLLLSEWSLATDDSVPLSRARMQQLAQVQLEMLRAAPSGWMFWAWRHDDELVKLSAWSLRQLIRERVIVVPTNDSATLVNSTARCKAGEALWKTWFVNATDEKDVVVYAVNDSSSSGQSVALPSASSAHRLDRCWLVAGVVAALMALVMSA